MQRRIPLLRTVLGLVVVLLAVSTLLLFVLRVDRVVVASGRLEGASVPVRSERAGRIVEIETSEGAAVAAGDVLVRLDSQGLEPARRAAELAHTGALARIETLRTERARLGEQAHPAARASAVREVNRTNLEVERAEGHLRMRTDLRERGLAGAPEVEEARINLRLAEIAVEEVRAARSTLDARLSAELAALDGEIGALDAEIARRAAERTDIQRRLAASVVRAPVDGIVAGLDLAGRMGSVVAEGEEILRVSTERPRWFRGRLPETGQSRATTGRPVHIRLTAYPWLLHGTLEGRVVSVSDTWTDEPGLPVEIALDVDDPPGPLRDGMTGKARIIVEEDIAPVRLLLDRLARVGRP